MAGPSSAVGTSRRTTGPQKGPTHDHHSPSPDQLAAQLAALAELARSQGIDVSAMLGASPGRSLP